MSPADFQRFHADLAAAVAAHVPVSFEANQKQPNQHRTLESLQRWQTQLSPLIEKSGSDSPSSRSKFWSDVSSSTANVPLRYVAALKTFAATDSMLPVLDGLTAPGIARQQVSRVVRWPLFYVFVVLLVAIAGLALFSTRVAPAVIAMRTDLELPAAIKSSNFFDVIRWLPTLLCGFVAAAIMICLAALTGGFRNTVSALGGQRYVNAVSSATALNTVPLLISAGMTTTEAADLSADLMMLDRKQLQDLDSAGSPSDSIAYCRGLANYRRVAADQQLVYLRVMVPLVLISFVGGVVGLLYGLAIYGPIVALIKDLTTAGT